MLANDIGGKVGDGLQAVTWWKVRDLEPLLRYNREDVRQLAVLHTHTCNVINQNRLSR